MSVLKKLSRGLLKTGGRNNRGRTTVFHIGGGHKRRYRYVDFKRNLFDIGGIVVSIEKDPNRSANIALITYSNGLMSYIIAPVGLKVGDKIVNASGFVSEEYSRIGSVIRLKNSRPGESLSNIELIEGKGAQIARAAGTSVQFVKKYDDENKVLLKLRSGEFREVNGDCLGLVGVVSNVGHIDDEIGKAGKSRWLGVRPTVRGVAMNPVDHPHGGGEGKKSGGAGSGGPKTPWGRVTKGRKTRKSSLKKLLFIKN